MTLGSIALHAGLSISAVDRQQEAQMTTSAPVTQSAIRSRARTCARSRKVTGHPAPLCRARTASRSLCPLCIRPSCLRDATDRQALEHWRQPRHFERMFSPCLR